MKIGIIVYSPTGNTYSVAEKLRDKLAAAGHTADIERIIAVDDEQKVLARVEFRNRPDPGAYEGLVFCAPVQGFALNPIMKAYMAQLPPLSGKKIACCITKYFANNWTGANQAVSKMRKFCAAQGGEIIGAGIVQWSSPRREQQMSEAVERLSGLF